MKRKNVRRRNMLNKRRCHYNLGKHSFHVINSDEFIQHIMLANVTAYAAGWMHAHAQHNAENQIRKLLRGNSSTGITEDAYTGLLGGQP